MWGKVAASGEAPNSRMQQMMAASKQEGAAEAAAAAKIGYAQSMAAAKRAWAAGHLSECDEQLTIAGQHTPHSDMLHRFRFKVHTKDGQYDKALEDAGNAVANAPDYARNHHALAMACHRKQKLAEAGAAYKMCMGRGLPGTSQEIGLHGYLNAVHSQRRYFNDLRPAHRKVAGAQSSSLARTPGRTTIFDPDKVFDDEVVLGDGPSPDPPHLFLVRAEENSLSVRWQPAEGTYPMFQPVDDDSGVGILGYELQAASHDVQWEGNEFFDDFREFETVHKGPPSVTDAVVHGLRTDNRVMIRVRARGEYGPGEWTELEASTLAAASKRGEALPLPRLWLQVDIADLVPLHVLATGREPKSFFTELASVFTPHVRTIRRLFSGWGRTTAVGQKGSKAGELSQQQFMRLCKEVGLAKDNSAAGKRMAGRSGAKVMPINDVDRIFQRANIDASENVGGRGGMKTHGLNLDRGQIAGMANAVLDELVANGAFVETEPGEAALREKLRTLFDAADKDGSGAVSTSEVMQMVNELGIDVNPKQIQRLVTEADLDGSGELEFEEVISVLKKQMAEEKAKNKQKEKDAAAGIPPKKKEGVSMVDLFAVEVEEEGDGGAASMVLHEFIHAMIRLSWESYPTPANAGIGDRLGALLDRALIPGSSHILEGEDPMEKELSSKRVQAVTSHYSDQLLEIFNTFAAADMSLSAQAALATMSFGELCFMAKAGQLIDGYLTVAKITEIFAQVNAQAADEGEKDDDADELDFREFKNCLCRCANAKIPAELRGDPPEPFEYTWQAFLQILFIPKMRKVIKDMKKGLIKKTM